MHLALLHFGRDHVQLKPFVLKAKLGPPGQDSLFLTTHINKIIVLAEIIDIFRAACQNNSQYWYQLEYCSGLPGALQTHKHYRVGHFK